jgi:hypothetical protein
VHTGDFELWRNTLQHLEQEDCGTVLLGREAEGDTQATGTQLDNEEEEGIPTQLHQLVRMSPMQPWGQLVIHADSLFVDILQALRLTYLYKLPPATIQARGARYTAVLADLVQGLVAMTPPQAPAYWGAVGLTAQDWRQLRSLAFWQGQIGEALAHSQWYYSQIKGAKGQKRRKTESQDVQEPLIRRCQGLIVTPMHNRTFELGGIYVSLPVGVIGAIAQAIQEQNLQIPWTAVQQPLSSRQG